MIDMILSVSHCEAIALLSVIDELALKEAIADIVNEEKEFTDEQKYMNTHKQARKIIKGSLHLCAMPFTTVIKKVSVKTFGISSKYQILVLQVIDCDQSTSPVLQGTI